jgi:hypothetical protein
MLEPSQFETNEAWIAFQLNDAPIRTEQDGDFNCVALMDAASCFILGTVFVAAAEAEPSVFEARQLFEAGRAQANRHPATLFVPRGQFLTILPAEAARHGIVVVPVHEAELSVFTGAARQSFREHVQGGRT